MQGEAVRATAVLVARRRMFSDLSDAARAELVDAAVEAYDFAWGPPGRPDDLEAWLAAGMYAAMMAAFRERRMLRRPLRIAESTTIEALLEEWLSSEPTLAGTHLPAVDQELTDRFLRQLSPADARLLWMRCEGYTREEIADLLGIRANAVSVRLHRLRIRLRETLAPMTDTTPTTDAGRDSGHGAA
jgi:RNA polymerase sigma factor (sigma-70 family)